MNANIRDIKPPLDLPDHWLWLLICLVVVIVVGVLIGLWIWMKRRPKAAVLPEIALVQVPAWQKAYDRLENLRQEKLIERSNLKPYYSELSNIIRRYLEEQFSMRAPEMTTEEFLGSLKNSNVLNDAQKETLKEFLLISDMVKFAKFQPSVNEAQKSFDLAKQLIDQTCLPAGKAYGI